MQRAQLRRRDVGTVQVSSVRFEFPAPSPPPPFAPPAPDASTDQRLEALERYTAVQDDAFARMRDDLRQHQDRYQTRDSAERTRRDNELTLQREGAARELVAVLLFSVGVALATWPDWIYCAIGRVL